MASQQQEVMLRESFASGELAEDIGFTSHKIPTSRKILYGLPRLPLSAMSLLLQVYGRKFYVDNLGVAAASMAMLVACCKSLDVLVGCAVGYFSDHNESKWGRRKPFITFGFPLWCATCIAIHSPPTSLSETGAMVWFGIFYFLFYSMGTSFTLIPYDALGMELTDDYNERSLLFAFKGSFQNGGYLLLGATATALAYLTDDARVKVMVPAFVFATGTALAFLLLVMKVPEFKVTNLQWTQLRAQPLIPMMRSMFENKPYLVYLLFKVPASISSLMPVNLLPYYLQYVGREPNPDSITSICIIIVVFAAILTAPVLVKCCGKFGKQRTLVVALVIQGVVYCAGTLVPPSQVTYYIIAMFVGAGIAAVNVIPDAMLADIIDYDTLHTETRREGLYTVVETNLQQFVEIPAGVLPLLVFSHYNYAENGGCGYGCAKDPLPDGVVDTQCIAPGNWEDEPCTYQPYDVQLWIKLFFLFIPGIFSLLACVPVHMSPITAEKHEKIIEATAKSVKGELAADPLTGFKVKAPRKDAGTNYRSQLSDWELRFASKSGVGSVIGVLSLQLAFWVAIASTCIALIAHYKNEYLTTCLAIFLAFVFAMIVWELIRLVHITKHKEIGQKYLTSEEVHDHFHARSMSLAYHRRSSAIYKEEIAELATSL